MKPSLCAAVRKQPTYSKLLDFNLLSRAHRASYTDLPSRGQAFDEDSTTTWQAFTALQTCSKASEPVALLQALTADIDLPETLSAVIGPNVLALDSIAYRHAQLSATLQACLVKMNSAR